MSNQITDKTSGAGARTQETKGFIRQVKRITRRKFTAKERIRIVLEGIRHEVPVREFCRREGVWPNVYNSWLSQFMEASKERLAHDTAYTVLVDRWDSRDLPEGARLRGDCVAFVSLAGGGTGVRGARKDTLRRRMDVQARRSVSSDDDSLHQ